MASSKEQKTCFIVTRYFVKRSKSICCIVRNGQGVDYTTCVHANGRTSCTCAAGQKGTKCYHVRHVVRMEEARGITTVAGLITPFPRATTAVKDKLTTAQPTDIGQKGSLNAYTDPGTRTAAHQSSSERSLPAIFFK